MLTATQRRTSRTFDGLPYSAGSPWVVAISGLLLIVATLLWLFVGAINGLTFLVIIVAQAAQACLAIWDEILYRGRWNGLSLLLLAILTWVAYYLPGEQLISGFRASRLSLLGVAAILPAREVPEAYSIAALALCAFSFGALSIRTSDRRTWIANSVQRALPTQSSRRLYFVLLIVIGSLFSFRGASPTQADLAMRGQTQGQGLQVALALCLPIGISYGILNSHWKSKFLACLSAVGLALGLAGAESRSPILIIGLAVAIRVLVQARSNRRVFLAGVLPLVVVGVVGSIFIVAFSIYRTSVLRGTGISLQESIKMASQDPVGQLASAGALDTLDGLTLSLRVAPQAAPIVHFWDPLKGVINLVPSQIWQNKPDFLGPEISHTFTQFGGQAGLFLSGPGYIYLIWGGALGVVIGFMLLGTVAGILERGSKAGGLGHCLWLYFLCRFFIGGDAFDILYVLTGLVGMFLIWVLAVSMRKLWGRKNA